jgi:hypothetical protein
MSFIVISLTYLSQLEQRTSPRIYPTQIKMTPKLQQMLCQFVSDYHQALLDNNAQQLLTFYAPTVKYYHLGDISKQIIFEEKQAYFKRWQYVEQTLLETPEVFTTNNPTEFQVSYMFKFRVKKPSGSQLTSTIGKGRQLWRLKEIANGFLILEEHQQIFYRYDD